MAEDDDEDRKREAKRRLDDLIGQAREAGKGLVAALREQARSNAADMGEPYSEDNAHFIDAISALAMMAEANVTDPAIAHVAALARTVTPRTRNEWSQARHQLDWCFDNEDHTGETVADDFPHRNPDNPTVADALLAKCAAYYHVPGLYQPLVADATRKVMAVRRKGWDELVMGWTNTYALVVAAICARCKPDPWRNDLGRFGHSVGG